MEDGVTGSDTPPKSQAAHKAGWLKKSSGGLLGLWKDRYILLRKAQLLVCESEVQDVKFLAKNAEERDAWIQALNEGINRGKNQIFDEVAQAVSDGSLRLDLDMLDSGVQSMVTPIFEKAERDPQKEPVKIPMPPSKPCPPPSADKPHLDTRDSDAKTPHPPSPPPKVLKENVYAREKLLSEGGEERKYDGNPGLKTPESGSIENIGETAMLPPKIPPKILSDKIKIKWMGSSSDLLDKVEMKPPERGSKENLVEFDSDEPAKLQSPPTEVVSEDMTMQQHELISSRGTGDQGGSDHPCEKTTETGEGLKDLSKKNLSEESTENPEEEAKEEPERHKVIKSETDAKKMPTAETAGVSDLEKANPMVPCTRTPIISASAETICPDSRPRSSSMGDFLSEVSMDSESMSEPKSSLLHLTKDHLHHVEMKLTRGRQTTETLLNRVLQGELMKSTARNGPEVNAETLLNEAVIQLREASQALQEMRESSSSSNASEALTETQKAKQKDLVTLYRRSLP
ncbi:pleckstrin homology domain-containing family O member 2 isoform X2 [Ascaphus truei]|uniref:pleckstrin homology domain-containing family O member 2 isoform X2 n=1 Tax=Ascaphus truei TaxID=8439 RepID=UPI003F5ACD09